MRGEFLFEEHAENKSLELGCEGINKNQDKWGFYAKTKENYIGS